MIQQSLPSNGLRIPRRHTSFLKQSANRANFCCVVDMSAATQLHRNPGDQFSTFICHISPQTWQLHLLLAKEKRAVGVTLQFEASCASLIQLLTCASNLLQLALSWGRNDHQSANGQNLPTDQLGDIKGQQVAWVPPAEVCCHMIGLDTAQRQTQSMRGDGHFLSPSSYRVQLARNEQQICFFLDVFNAD
jgi:hypothetical protein